MNSANSFTVKILGSSSPIPTSKLDISNATKIYEVHDLSLTAFSK